MKECTTEVYGKLKSGVIDFYYASKRPNDSEYEQGQALPLPTYIVSFVSVSNNYQ